MNEEMLQRLQLAFDAGELEEIRSLVLAGVDLHTVTVVAARTSNIELMK